MTATEARSDAKAGFCGRCRAGDHALCASPADRCACTERRHPNRPSTRPQEAAVPAAARPIASAPSAVPSVVVRWEDPPDTSRGRKPAQMFAPELLAELERNPGKWARVDNLKSKSGASSRAKGFRSGKYAPVAPPLWEAVGRATPTGSAFYLRFVGPEAE